MRVLDIPKEARIRVLHFVGAQADVGGILSCIRSMAASGGVEFNHEMLNAAGFVQTRSPKLQSYASRWLYADMCPNIIVLSITSLLAALGFSCSKLRKRVSIVHAHTRGGILCAVFLLFFTKVPLVVTNHTYARNRWAYRWLTYCRRITSVFLTPEMVRYYGVDTTRGNVAIVSEGFDSSLLCKALGRSRLADAYATFSPGNPLRLLGVGSLFVWKKWDTIVASLALLPADIRACVRFDHWGAVPSAFQDHYQSILNKVTDGGLSNQVCFHGSSSSVISEMREADALVVASLNEPCSVALLEALAIGLPVLAANSGGNRDIIREGENGVFFETGDAAGLACVMERIVAGKLRFPEPEAIRASVRNRSGSAVAEAYHALYRQCISKRKREG